MQSNKYWKAIKQILEGNQTNVGMRSNKYWKVINKYWKEIKQILEGNQQILV